MSIQDDVLQKLKEIRSELVHQYGIAELGVFGSIARGEETAAKLTSLQNARSLERLSSENAWKRMLFMSEKDIILIDDIIDSIEKIRSYTKGITFDDFSSDDMRVDAVVRNLEIVGEAATERLPSMLQVLRDFLAKSK